MVGGGEDHEPPARHATDSRPEGKALARASKRVVLRVTPEKVASWDHRKLGGAY